MATSSPELKQLWIRVQKRVHPDLAIDEQDRIRCEQLTKLANEAYQAGDVDALRGVLSPSQPPIDSPRTSFSFKQLRPVAITVVILIGGGFSLYSVTTGQRAVTNSPVAQVHGTKAHGEVGQPPPSKWYGDVIHNRISRNFNPSTVANTPAGATAVIGFTISREGSPQSVSLVASSWYPSLDFSCVNAVRQVKTFGPPEGGNKDSLNVIYNCSYHPKESQQAPQQISPPPVASAPVTSAPVASAPVASAPVASAPVVTSAKPSHLYMKQMAERLHQNFREYELVDASVPAGNSAELWFDVNRDGSLSNVRIGKPSGWNSLDYACIRAAQRTPTVGALPEEYKLRTLPASFACNYTGGNASRTNLYVGSVRDTSHGLSADREH
jgi:TonB family protein